MKKRVYVTHEKRGFDYSGALEYGEVKFLTRREYLPYPSVSGNEEIFDEVWGGLDGYRPGVDYILLSGSPALMFLVGAMACDIAGDLDTRHNVLKWNGQRKAYDLCYM